MQNTLHHVLAISLDLPLPERALPAFGTGLTPPAPLLLTASPFIDARFGLGKRKRGTDTAKGLHVLASHQGSRAKIIFPFSWDFLFFLLYI